MRSTLPWIGLLFWSHSEAVCWLLLWLHNITTSECSTCRSRLLKSSRLGSVPMLNCTGNNCVNKGRASLGRNFPQTGRLQSNSETLNREASLEDDTPRSCNRGPGESTALRIFAMSTACLPSILGPWPPTPRGSACADSKGRTTVGVRPSAGHI